MGTETQDEGVVSIQAIASSPHRPKVLSSGEGSILPATWRPESELHSTLDGREAGKSIREPLGLESRPCICSLLLQDLGMEERWGQRARPASRPMALLPTHGVHELFGANGEGGRGSKYSTAGFSQGAQEAGEAGKALPGDQSWCYPVDAGPSCNTKASKHNA